MITSLPLDAPGGGVLGQIHGVVVDSAQPVHSFLLQLQDPDLAEFYACFAQLEEGGVLQLAVWRRMGEWFKPLKNVSNVWQLASTSGDRALDEVAEEVQGGCSGEEQMSALGERLRSPAIKLGIRQFRLAIEFATAVEDELCRRKMKKATLAEILGKSRAWVTKALRKKQNLTLFTAVELADALDMDVKIQVVPRPTNFILLGSHTVPNDMNQGAVPAPPLKPLDCCEAA